MISKYCDLQPEMFMLVKLTLYENSIAIINLDKLCLAMSFINNKCSAEDKMSKHHAHVQNCHTKIKQLQSLKGSILNMKTNFSRISEVSLNTMDSNLRIH